MDSWKSDLPFFVIGHRNPDTDAICSAIGHASLLRLTGEPAATAARCGELTMRTAWVLQEAGLEAPVLIDDVRTTAGMMCRREVVQVSPNDTFLTAYQKMLSAGVRAVPVVDETQQVMGILRYLDLLELLVPAETEGLAVRTVLVALKNMAKTLHAESCGAPYPTSEDEENLIILVGASSQDTVSKRLQKAQDDGSIGRFLVICGDRPHVHKMAIESGVRALLITGGYNIDPDLERLAREKNISILLAKQDTASCTTLIRCSRTVRHVLDAGFINVPAEEPVSLLKKRLTTTAQELFPVVSSEQQLVGVVSKSDLVDPPRLRLALVDHNEYAQAVRGVEEAEIVEVIDHHRLAGNLVSREPIRYLNEPVGSTSTLVARKFAHRDLTPERGVSLCLLAGIVSDTLNLTSPTTTDLDREMLLWLAQVAQVDAAEFTRKFFAIGSLLANGTVEEIVNADRKEFADDGLKISIAQVEELGMEALAEREAELIPYLGELTRKERLDLICLVITDVTEHFSHILAVGNEALIDALPYQRITANSFSAPGVVSRKKQIFPAVCQAIRMAQR
ncbi:MAG: putative manganese-dependent inorganic diphosphatase [Akkermansiaceae bacterium]